jgi:hypothetical protein
MLNDNATPAAIREYLELILVQNHGASEDVAQLVAAKWQYGRGTEFRNFNIHTYREIFGAELGAVFWGYAQGITSSPIPVPVGEAQRPEDPMFPGKHSTFIDRNVQVFDRKYIMADQISSIYVNGFRLARGCVLGIDVLEYG